MFENLETLSIEQLIEKQIELRKKLMQASSMGMTGAMAQIQNMLDACAIELRTKSEIQNLDKEREKKIEDGKDPNDDVLNIGE